MCTKVEERVVAMKKGIASLCCVSKEKEKKMELLLIHVLLCMPVALIEDAC